MLSQLRDRLGARDEHDHADHSSELTPLRMLTAPMLLVTGLEATLDLLAHDRDPSARASLAWGPTLLAPIAAAAQVAHLTRPSASVTNASRLLNAAVIGAGVVGLAGTLRTARRYQQPPSLAPLAMAAVGLLGLVLDRQEEVLHQEKAQRERQQRRGALKERLLPARRARVDRIVVHV